MLLEDSHDLYLDVTVLKESVAGASKVGNATLIKPEKISLSESPSEEPLIISLGAVLCFLASKIKDKNVPPQRRGGLEFAIATPPNIILKRY